MTFPFDSEKGLILISVILSGPKGNTSVTMALDTGATHSLVDAKILSNLGYDLNATSEHLRITTGSGSETVSRLPVDLFDALGVARTNFPVLGHHLPSTSTVDGLLGLDFLRGYRLTIDFPAGLLTLE